MPIRFCTAGQIAPSSSSEYYVPSSSYALPPPLDFQFHVPADCDQICTNTQGSYSCSCVSGYRLSSDGKSCLGEVPSCPKNERICLLSRLIPRMKVSLDHPKYSMNPVDVCGCGNRRTTNLYNVLNPRGGGGIPGNSWWGCATRFSKS